MAIVTRTLKDGKTKRYDATLWVQIEGGRRRQIWKTFKKRWHAVAWLNKTDQSNRDGEYFEPAKKIFSEFADEWIEKYRRKDDSPLKLSTRRLYQSIIEHHLKPFFGPMLLTQIRPVVIERDFKGRLREVSPGTRRNVLVLLRKMLATAVFWNDLKINPFNERVIVPTSTNQKRTRALNPSEIQSLLDHCEGEAYAVVLTAILTGMRRSELFGLRWEDVDFEKNLIHVRQAVYWAYGKRLSERERGFSFVSPKTARSVRSIDMGPKLRSVLRQHGLRTQKLPNPHGLVFPTFKGTPHEPGNFIDNKFRPAVKAAKLGELRFHELRHTFGSLKIEQGENIYHVQRWLGHASIKTTIDIYGHLIRESNPESAARTDALIFGPAIKTG